MCIQIKITPTFKLYIIYHKTVYYYYYYGYSYCLIFTYVHIRTIITYNEAQVIVQLNDEEKKRAFLMVLNFFLESKLII